MAYTVFYKKEKEREFQQVTLDLRTDQIRYQSEGTAESRKAWHSAKLYYEACQDIREQLSGQLSTLFFYKHGNKAGKLLVRMARGPCTSTPICSLRDSIGSLQTKPHAINEIFRDFYNKLYADDTPTVQSPDRFFEELLNTRLTTKQLEVLNLPIQDAEIRKVILALSNNKSPGRMASLPNITKPHCLRT